MSDRYLILRELGQEDGPFTVEELRQLLTSGRLRSHDRLRPQDGRQQVPVAELIPDCAEISAARPSASDRIRRKTSDRRPAIASRSEPRIPVVQDPAPVPDPPPLTERGPALPTVNGSSKLRMAKILGVVVGVLAPFALWLSWPQEKLWLIPADLQGTWVAVMPGAGAADIGKPMTLIIKDGSLDTEQNGRTVTVRFEVFLGSADGLVLDLQPAHPRLGARISFVREGGNMLLMQGDRGIPLVRR